MKEAMMQTNTVALSEELASSLPVLSCAKQLEFSHNSQICVVSHSASAEWEILRLSRQGGNSDDFCAGRDKLAPAESGLFQDQEMDEQDNDDNDWFPGAAMPSDAAAAPQHVDGSNGCNATNYSSLNLSCSVC